MRKVIVKFLSGEEKKGVVLFFNIQKPTFSLQITSEEGLTKTQTVSLNSVKAIYFLKEEGVSESQMHKETIDQSTFASSVAFKLMVEFKDGEVMHGTAIKKYHPEEKGFYLVPLNPADISERIYINAQAVKNVDQKRLLGKILTDQEKITTENLHEALDVQKEKREKKLGDILIEKGIINETQLNESLDRQKEELKFLGEVLIEAGYISPEQLKHALELQKGNREKRLGQVLVDLKYVTPNDICVALASQFHTSWIDLSTAKIQWGIATYLPEEVVRRLKVIPVERKMGDILVVATSQPQNPDLVSEISKYTPLKIELIVAYEKYIEAAIDYYFPPKK